MSCFRNKLLAIAPLATGFLLLVSLSSDWKSNLAWLALVPIGLTLAARRIPRATYSAAFLAGLSLQLCAMSWLLNCYRGDRVVGPYLVDWFWLGCWGGAIFFIAFAGGRWLVQRSRLPMVLLLPTLWVTFEFLRHESVELMFGTGFPWLKLGFSLTANQIFVQSANLGGEYLLTFLLVLPSGAIIDSFLLHTTSELRRAKWWKPVVAACVVLLIAWTYGYLRLEQSSGAAGPTVALMGERDLPPMLFQERLDLAFQVEGQIGTERHADLLLWPELVYHHKIFDDNRSKPSTLPESSPSKKLHQVGFAPAVGQGTGRSYLEQSTTNLQSTLVIGCQREELNDKSSRLFNSLACADYLNGFQGCYDKRHLVTGSESPLDRRISEENPSSVTAEGEATRIFDLPTPSAEYRFGTAICYDVCFGRHFHQSEADFFVQSGSEGHDRSGRLAAWMLRYARLRAIENRRAIVRNTTFGISGLIDSNGIVQNKIPSEPIIAPIWLGSIPIDNRLSAYSFLGDWLAYLSTSAVVLLLLSGRRSAQIQ